MTDTSFNNAYGSKGQEFDAELRENHSVRPAHSFQAHLPSRAADRAVSLRVNHGGHQ